MTRRSTVRLLTAVFLAVLGAIAAILAGRPDAAVVVSPWAILLALGLSGVRRPSLVGAVVSDRPRVLAGEEVTLTATITGGRGWIETKFQPDAGFWPGAGNPNTGSSQGQDQEQALTETGVLRVMLPCRSPALRSQANRRC